MAGSDAPKNWIRCFSLCIDAALCVSMLFFVYQCCSLCINAVLCVSKINKVSKFCKSKTNLSWFCKNLCRSFFYFIMIWFADPISSFGFALWVLKRPGQGAYSACYRSLVFKLFPISSSCWSRDKLFNPDKLLHPRMSVFLSVWVYVCVCVCVCVRGEGVGATNVLSY